MRKAAGKRWSWWGAGLAVATAVALGSCEDAGDLQLPAAPAAVAPGVTPPVPAAPSDDAVFFDDFETGVMPKWDAMEGNWFAREGGGQREYGPEPREPALAVAGRNGWKDYQLEARITVVDDRFGMAGVAARAQWSHHYVELLLGRNLKAEKSWFIRQRNMHQALDLATGGFDYELGKRYVLRFVVRGDELIGEISADEGNSFTRLGAVTAGPNATTQGRIGLVSYGANVRFDDVSVIPGDVLFARLDPWWAEITNLRDNTATFPNRPSGGWYVTPIHATVRASDGKVLLTGFGRRQADNCTTGFRETGTTFLLDPNDLAVSGGTMFVTPINEQNATSAGNTDVLYCAGHNTMADGRIFFSAGTRYMGGLPDFDDEHGVNYSRIYDPAAGTFGAFTRITAAMSGGDPDANGMKWYPTNLLLPDGKILIFGGFHYSSPSAALSAVVPKPNTSYEIFDPAKYAMNPAGNPYTVLTQHGQGSQDTPPTRGYSNLFLLPKPVPAGSAGGRARTVVVHGGVGRAVLFTHERGANGASRVFAGAVTSNPSMPKGSRGAEKGEGASGVLLPDGRLMFVGGGHSGSGAASNYYYNTYSNTWDPPSANGITRVYGDAVWLPNGTVLAINGYQGPGEDGNENDIDDPANIVGNVRRPQIIDPFTKAVDNTLTPWPELTHRGYHSIAVLLKDGRVLVGGGKDIDHDTGCEKNELRIYTPPYLLAGPRPIIETPSEGTTMTVGGGPVTINFAGASVRSTRGVVLLAPGSITHSFDSGQRYVPLTVVSGPTASSVTVLPPENPNIAQPGDYMLFLVSTAGVPSVGVHIRLLPATPRVYTVAGNTFMEAECASLRTGPWATVNDATRSAGQFVQVTPGSGNHTTVPDEGKVSWFDLDVTAPGNYAIYALAQGPTTSDDSFWISIDGGADTNLVPVPAWGWVRLGTGTFALDGRHQLRLKVREDGTRIDKLYLSQVATAPTGLGGPAQLSCGGTMCMAPPTPAGVTASAQACQATVSWGDVAGEDGYRIERNGAIVATLPAGTTSFVDAPLAAGTYTYRVQSFASTCSSAFSTAVMVTVACTPTGPSISNLVVNDTTAGNDGIANNTQWTIQSSFGTPSGQLAFGDRTYTINALTGMAATLLQGKPWIRTAADSKSYAATSPPLATATLTGTRVNLAVDSRHATAFLTNAGFASAGYAISVQEGGTARTYNVWSKAFTSGSTVTLPSIGATTAPCYFVIVE